ncbi:MAG: DUF1648 domain-containing protein [Pyrinomonadaceae bacterium]
MQLRHLIFGVLVLLFAAQAFYYYPILPAVVSSHFDGVGDPNGWMAKGSFFALEFVFLALVIGEMTLLPWLVARMPDSLINLPNKTYWLVPERREYAFDVFRSYFQWFSVGLLLMLICVNQLAFLANLKRQALGSAIWLILGVYLSCVVVWLIKFVLAFRKPV